VRVLLVGSGGREHALAWKLAHSPLLDDLHAAPGNPGIATLATCHPVRADDGEAVLALAQAIHVELVVVGPEAPLVAGLADALRHAGIPVFGPGADAARIEGSKAFAKEVMAASGVPATRRLDRAEAPCVVKYDGLAAGKGVFVCRTREELEHALERVARLGGEYLIEELTEGEEVSVFALSDGDRVVAVGAAEDYKRVGDRDTGPNTGGMGSLTPVPGIDADAIEELVSTIHRPVVRELSARGTPFVGVLYAGVMRTDDGPRVFEFNCRFGDPEAQVLLPCLDDDLLPALAAAAHGDLGGLSLGSGERAAVTVTLAARDYPERGDVGTPIDGIAAAEATGALVFHAGTALREGGLVTNGGRILNVTGVGATVQEARDRAYAGVARITFAGAHYRTDIAAIPEHVAG
jgi:phosphoribosylamine--glycine ligase